MKVEKEVNTMERYKDINGDSGVIAYECGTDYIRVQFSTGQYISIPTKVLALTI